MTKRGGPPPIVPEKHQRLRQIDRHDWQHQAQLQRKEMNRSKSFRENLKET